MPRKLPTLDEPLDLGGAQASELTRDEPIGLATSTSLGAVAPVTSDVPAGEPTADQLPVAASEDINVDATAADLAVIPGRPLSPPPAPVGGRVPAAPALRPTPASSLPPAIPSAIRPGERPRTEDLMVGTLLDGRYEILEVIGRGAMGVVYRARQSSADREVAVKVLIPEVSRKEKSLARFANEAKIISRLRHPNTLRLFDCRTDRGGLMYIVTELLHGTPLGRLITKKGPLPVARALHIADEVASSLAEAHEAGIIHRDIKPDNVFLERLGDDDVVKVLDFGIAKLLDDKSALTTFGTLVGTPAYVSPEQAMGRDLDARSDLYALGVLLHHMLGGVPPFKAATAADTIAMHLHAPVPPIPRPAALDPVSPALEALVRELLAKSPAARPGSAAQVRERLKVIRSAASLAPNAAAAVPPAAPSTEPADKERRIFGRISSAVGRLVSKPGSD